MLITKENRKKIKTIAVKMQRMGFGDEKELVTELNKRYVDLQFKKLNLEGGD